MSAVSHQQLATWLDPQRKLNDPVDLGKLKATLVARGVNSRGWRLFLEYGDALFEPLGKPWVHRDLPFSSSQNAIDWLRLLQSCEMDVLPPPQLVASIADWKIPGSSLTAIPHQYFRKAWKASISAIYSPRSLIDFIETEVIPVSIWLFQSDRHIHPEPGLFTKNWEHLLQRVQEAERLSAFFREQIESAIKVGEENESAPHSQLGWDPYVRRIEWGGYVFIALTTAAELKEEGKTMQHCVADYDENCRGGTYRIYSVREKRSGLRVATCSLECTADGDELTWELDQVKGIRNAEVPRQALVAADAVLRSYLDLPPERFQRPTARARVTVDDLDDDIPF